MWWQSKNLRPGLLAPRSHPRGLSQSVLPSWPPARARLRLTARGGSDPLQGRFLSSAGNRLAASVPTGSRFPRRSHTRTFWNLKPDAFQGHPGETARFQGLLLTMCRRSAFPGDGGYEALPAKTPPVAGVPEPLCSPASESRACASPYLLRGRPPQHHSVPGASLGLL